MDRHKIAKFIENADGRCAVNRVAIDNSRRVRAIDNGKGRPWTSASVASSRSDARIARFDILPHETFKARCAVVHGVQTGRLRLLHANNNASDFNADARPTVHQKNVWQCCGSIRAVVALLPAPTWIARVKRQPHSHGNG